MSLFLIYVLLWFWDNRSFDAVKEANMAREQAQTAYIEGDYATAASLYRKIISNFTFIDPVTRVNLAHASFLNGEINTAEDQYKLLTKSDSRRISTIAQIQLGMIALQKKDTAMALSNLKSALKISPSNEIARYNYEILRRQFSGIPAPVNTGASNTSDQKTEKESKEQVKFAEIPEPAAAKKDLLEKLNQMHLSEEETQAILDAMKANELQYIYQLRRNQYHSTGQSQNKKAEW